MTYEQYRKTEFSEGPYVLVIRSSASPDHALYYFGEQHSFNDANPQWDKVKTLWKEFLATTSGKRIAIVEGGKRAIRKAEQESILEDGGMGLLTFLASQEGIETYSAEPSEAFERSELEKNFSRDQIQYYYFARMAYQWNRKEQPKPDFEKYMEWALTSDAAQSGWKDYDFSLAHMKQIHRDILNTEFSEADADFLFSVIDPTVEKGTIVNAVSQGSSIVRDMFIVNEIQRLWTEGYSIFAQYGWSHVAIQEPLLREIIS